MLSLCSLASISCRCRLLIVIVRIDTVLNLITDSLDSTGWQSRSKLAILLKVLFKLISNGKWSVSCQVEGKLDIGFPVLHDDLNPEVYHVITGSRSCLLCLRGRRWSLLLKLLVRQS